jgi:hypothetical protein
VDEDGGLRCEEEAADDEGGKGEKAGDVWVPHPRRRSETWGSRSCGSAGEVDGHEREQEGEQRVSVVGEGAGLQDAVDKAEDDAGGEECTIYVEAGAKEGGTIEREDGEPDDYERKQGREAVQENVAERAVSEAGVVGDEGVESAKERGERAGPDEKGDDKGGSDEIGQ